MDPADVAARIGTAITELRVEAGMTQEELGEAVGALVGKPFAKPQSAISKWEKGDSAISIVQLIAAEEAMSYTAGETLRRAGLWTGAPTLDDAIRASTDISPRDRETLLHIATQLRELRHGQQARRRSRP